MAGKKILGFLPSLLFGVFILVVSLIPVDFEAKRVFLFRGFDKVVHAGLYGCFILLILLGMKRGRLISGKNIVLVCAAVLLYSVMIELIQQYFIQYRSGDVLDVLANFTGMMMGLLGYLMLIRIKS